VRIRRKRIEDERIKEEIRKLNQLAKTEICTRIDEKAAVDLLLRLGVPAASEVGISPVIKYRLLVGGLGIAYEGESEPDAKRRFKLFVMRSKNTESSSFGESVTLFRNFDVVGKHYRPDRE
jgi:hypothetical protein